MRHLRDVLPSAQRIQYGPDGTNCVIFHIVVDGQHLAGRFEPAVEPFSRDDLVRKAICTVTASLTAAPSCAIVLSNELIDTPFGPYRFVMSEWLPHGNWPVGLDAASRMALLGSAVAELHRSLDLACVERLVAKDPPMVYWDTHWPSLDEVSPIAAALPAAVGHAAVQATMTVLSAVAQADPVAGHGDLHGENVHLSPTGPRFLDFDFCRVQPLVRQLDVGILLHRLCRQERLASPTVDELALAEAFLRGYGSVAGSTPSLSLVLACALLESVRKWWHLQHLIPSGVGGRAYWAKVHERHRVFLTEITHMINVSALAR